jgi:hypothetical protein
VFGVRSANSAECIRRRSVLRTTYPTAGLTFGPCARFATVGLSV